MALFDTQALENRLVTMTAQSALQKQTPSDADLGAAARLKLLLADNGRIVVVTGIDSKDDTAQLAARLAVALASLGPEHALLIEGNVQRPVLQKMFGAEDTAGFSDVLAQTADLTQAVHPGGLPNLFFTPLGSQTESLATLLNGSAATEFFSQIRERFRWIIVNVGVVSSSAEGILLGAASDGVVAGLTIGKRRRHELEHFSSELKRFGMKLLGAVLLQERK